MYKHLAIYSDMLFNGISKMLGYFIIMIIIFSGFFGTIDTSAILILSVGIIILNILVTKLTFRNVQDLNKTKMIILIIGGIISLSIAILLIDKFNLMEIIYLFIYFFIVWLSNTVLSYDVDVHESSLRGFILTLATIGVLIGSFNAWRTDLRTIFLSEYFFLFCIINIINLVRLNIQNAYEEKEDKTVINKSKNMIRINSLFTIVVLVLIVLLATDVVHITAFLKGSRDMLLNGLSLLASGVGIIISPLIVLLVKVIQYVINLISPGDLSTEDLFEFDNSYISEASERFDANYYLKFTNIASWIVLILVLLVGGVYFFSKLKKFHQRKIHATEGDIEKDFIFDRDEAIRNNPLVKAIRKISSFLQNKNKHRGNKNIVRELYIECVKRLEKGNKEFKNTCTPNEYLNIIDKNLLVETKFNNLTYYYNKNRYGNKSITEDEIQDSINIRNALLNYFSKKGK